MKESDYQWVFLRSMAELILWADSEGYKLTGGDLQSRPGNLPKHSRRSFHYRRRALDLNLFINGEYQRKTEAHEPLGRRWEAMGGVWGGEWDDGNHYQL